MHIQIDERARVALQRKPRATGREDLYPSIYLSADVHSRFFLYMVSANRSAAERGAESLRDAMSLKVLVEQRQEEMLREVELYRLKKALRAERKKPASSLWASTVAWELMRIGGLLRKFLRVLRRANQNRQR